MCAAALRKQEIEELHLLDTTAWATEQDQREGFYEEAGGRGAASGLWLEGMVCSMLTVMLGRDLDIATRV